MLVALDCSRIEELKLTKLSLFKSFHQTEGHKRNKIGDALTSCGTDLLLNHQSTDTAILNMFITG